ncbi:exonuclease domain-containing protein [Ruminococcus sp.]|uniref:exonuclease domain-containing protein n=1 Tax=Ruminococcus sp. TaxID=41978 RepID=UPI003FD7800F
MSIWDDYKTSVRTRINVKQDRLLLTERQWKLKHYIKIDDKCGRYLWVNAYCPNQELYLWDEEVRKMTDEELTAYRTKEKEKRVARQKAFLQQQKVKKEEELLQLRREITQDIVKSIIKNTFTAQIFDSGIEYEYDEIVIDTATTGLNADTDELLQVSIIDGQGNTLFNSYIKPLYTDNWNKAMAVNHITPETVATAPNILEVKQEISRIINSAHTIIGYNVDFDLGFLSNIGIRNENAAIVDVMEDFADIYGEWSEQYGCHKWQKLTKCAEYYGYDWGTDIAHDSLADCKATLYCYQKMLQEEHM